MAYRFRTPTVSEGPAGQGPLFERFRLVRGITVLRIDGEYFQVRFPSSEEVQAAEVAYIGGYSYEVDEAEKTRLEAAGYTVETV
jgi:hypothetical protein